MQGIDWGGLEETAIWIGLELDIFWNLTPYQFEKYIKVYKEKEQRKLEEWDYMNWLSGMYIRSAVNSKKYIDKPFFESQKKNNVMSNEEMERVLRQTANRINSKYKQNGN